MGEGNISYELKKKSMTTNFIIVVIKKMKIQNRTLTQSIYTFFNILGNIFGFEPKVWFNSEPSDVKRGGGTQPVVYILAVDIN